MRRECRERFPRHRGWAIPTCITARASHTCRDACRDQEQAVSFEIGGGGKRSRHSRRMRNLQFYVSGKRPILLSAPFELRFLSNARWLSRENGWLFVFKNTRASTSGSGFTDHLRQTKFELYPVASTQLCTDFLLRYNSRTRHINMHLSVRLSLSLYSQYTPLICQSIVSLIWP